VENFLKHISVSRADVAIFDRKKEVGHRVIVSPFVEEIYLQEMIVHFKRLLLRSNKSS